ncbi:MAG: glycosyltransferase family 39 protein [Anaerolineaceae bacterium]|nr:glycosyltransferase family 39 protein [Anaerolineaceae bacterium]
MGAIFRLINLGRDSLWLDEAISYLAAQLPVTQIANNTLQDPHPPLYYLLLHFWLQLVPDSDTAVKLLSALFGILLIPAIYFLSQQLFHNRTISLTAAALTAVSPFHILYSHELRMYTCSCCWWCWQRPLPGSPDKKKTAAGGWWLVACFYWRYIRICLPFWLWRAWGCMPCSLTAATNALSGPQPS